MNRMKCKNCIHYRLCRDNDLDYDDNVVIKSTCGECLHYTDRSEWVHLPCKVGDKTFLLLEKTNGGYDIIESKCVRITDNGYGKCYSMFFDCAELGNTLEFYIYDFDKWVFLTREEAEKALGEKK